MSRKTKAQRYADELRTRCNKLTPAERKRYHKVAMAIINRKRPT